MTATRYGTENHSPGGSPIEERNGLWNPGSYSPAFPKRECPVRVACTGLFTSIPLSRGGGAPLERRRRGGRACDARKKNGIAKLRSPPPTPLPAKSPPRPSSSSEGSFVHLATALPSLPSLSPAGRDGERTPSPPLPSPSNLEWRVETAVATTNGRPTDRPSERGGGGGPSDVTFLPPPHTKRGGGGGGNAHHLVLPPPKGGGRGWKKKSKEDEGWKQMRAMCLCPPFFFSFFFRGGGGGGDLQSLPFLGEGGRVRLVPSRSGSWPGGDPSRVSKADALSSGASLFRLDFCERHNLCGGRDEG